MGRVNNKISPSGIAFYPYLTVPKTRFKPKGVFETGLIVSPEDAEPLKEYIESFLDSEYDTLTSKLKPQVKKQISKHYPWTPEYDEDDNETGNTVFKFSTDAVLVNKKTGEEYEVKLKIVDANNEEIPRTTKIKFGSVIKVAYRPFAYYMPTNKTVGVKLYLNGVQVLALADSDEDEDFSVETGEFEVDYSKIPEPKDDEDDAPSF